MKIVKSNVAAWVPTEGHSYKTGEDLTISSERLVELCKFNGVPATLVGVDKKYGTNTTKNVLSVALEQDPLFVVDDDGTVLSALNPKSQFMTDDQYGARVESFTKMGLHGEETRHGASIRTIFELEADDADLSFNNDIFRKRAIVERLAEGGVLFTVGLLRLICTNGSLVPDSQFKRMLHKSSIPEEIMSAFVSDALAFNLREYFEKLWHNEDGSPVMASVADYLGMKSCLAKISDDDTCDLCFPEEPILSHYSAQGIEVKELPRTMQQKLPSGVTYYDAYNFLTHGVRLIEGVTLKDEIEVANWSRPSKLKQMKQSDIVFRGAPFFDPETIRQLRGDSKE